MTRKPAGKVPAAAAGPARPGKKRSVASTRAGPRLAGEARKTTIAFRLRISKGEDIAVGPGKIDLLEAIAATGSITAAARHLGMSYRRAWLLVDTMNRSFRVPVVAAEAGGARGGGTALTALGAEVVLRYRRIEKAAARAGAADLQAFLALLAR
jgi:molybdate transport system regulatory protein